MNNLNTVLTTMRPLANHQAAFPQTLSVLPDHTFTPIMNRGLIHSPAASIPVHPSCRSRATTGLATQLPLHPG